MSETPTTVQSTFTRFSRTQRWEHALLLISFSVLVITGIPQKYVPAPWAEFMIYIMGGIELVRVVHRISAIVMVLASAFHFIGLLYRMYVRRSSLSMLPVWKDFVDFLDALRWSLGLAKRPPRYPHFSFEEKVEYWAVVWGTVVMVITGFMLWNPISTTRLLPGEFIPAAKAAHGGEAVLAALAILVWHFYNVHLKTFNKSIFTGKMTRDEMEHEHAAELAQIDAGDVRPDTSREVIRKRERIFIPLAALTSIVVVIILVIFVTYEETAIATIPPLAEEVVVFVRATPTPQLSTEEEQALWLDQTEASPIPHAIGNGRDDCFACHAASAIAPYTDIHAEIGLGNETCLTCHSLLETETGDLPTVEVIALPSFTRDIMPALIQNCIECHDVKDGLDLSNFSALMSGGEGGPVIVPGIPETSRFMLVQSMPLEAHPTRLSPEELELVSAWILSGAPNN